MKTTKESFEDIIFENRNRDYGAYELRRKYLKRGTLAFIVSVSFLFLCVGAPLVASIMKHRNITTRVINTDVIKLEKVKVDIEKVTPPPPPAAPKVAEYKFRPPIVVDSILNEEKELDANVDLSQNFTNLPVDTSSHKETLVVVEKENIIGGDEVFLPIAIQEQPVFPGGEKALLNYIADNTKYPALAQETGTEGTVYIRFVVTKSGEVGTVSVMRAVDPLLEEEALRVVKTLPKWTPGKNNGNPVNVWFVMPVKFKLQ